MHTVGLTIWLQKCLDNNLDFYMLLKVIFIVLKKGTC